MEDSAALAARSEQTPSRQSLQVQPTEWDNSLQTKVEDIVENMTQQQIYLSEIQTQVIAESDRLASSNQALYDLVEKLKKELTQKGMSADDCQQRVNELEHKISQLKLDIKNKDEKISGLNETIAELESHISDLEQQLQDKQDEMDEMLKEQGLDRDKTIAAKQAEIVQLLKDKAALSTKIDDLTDEVNNLEKRITQLEENLLNAQQNLKQEKESKKQIEQDQNALRDELAACKVMSDQLRTELIAMGDRNNEIVLQKEVLQKAIQNLKKKIRDQLDYILEQKKKLIDVPVAQLQKTSANLRAVADKAVANADRAQLEPAQFSQQEPAQFSQSDYFSNTNEEEEVADQEPIAQEMADQEEVADQEPTVAEQKQTKKKQVKHRDEQYLITPVESTTTRQGSVKPIGAVGNKSANVPPEERQNIITRSGRTATKFVKYTGGGLGLPPALYTELSLPPVF